MDKLLSAFQSNELGRESQKQIMGGYKYVYAYSKRAGDGVTFDYYGKYSDDGGTYYGNVQAQPGYNDDI
jgi:hypothetical protein